MKHDRRIPDLIGMTEAGRILGIGRSAVHKRIQADQLPAARVGGVGYVMRRQLVEQIAAEQAQRQAA